MPTAESKLVPDGVARLIAIAREGDAVTFGQLLEKYRHYLRFLAGVEIGRRMQGKVDASDVVQETFLNAHKYFPGFRGQEEGQFIHWLREILAGTLANQLRRYLGTKARDIRLERGLMADLDHSSMALAAIPVDPRPSPSENAQEGERTLIVADALGRLPEHYRAVIVLRHLEGLSMPEVARRMEKTVASVEKLWLRALAMLKGSLREMP